MCPYLAAGLSPNNCNWEGVGRVALLLEMLKSKTITVWVWGENERKDHYVTPRFTLLVHTDQLETMQANIRKPNAGNISN